MHFLDKTKTKNEKLMTEMMYTLYYLTKDSEENAMIVLQMIPDLHKKIANELGTLASTLESTMIRPAIRILGTLISVKLDLGQDLIYDNKFETFVLTVMHQPLEQTSYKRECLWVLSNILGGPSEHNFEIILDNKDLLGLIVDHA